MEKNEQKVAELQPDLVLDFDQNQLLELTPAGQENILVQHHTYNALMLSHKFDAAVKQFFIIKPVLAYILRDCVKEFAGCSIQEIIDHGIQAGTITVSKEKIDDESDFIEPQSNESKSKQEGDIFYDIKFQALAPGDEQPIGLIINLEPQQKLPSKYPLVKRAVYYCSRLISDQKNKIFQNSDYGKINKVYSIWVCYNVPERLQNSIIVRELDERVAYGDPSLASFEREDGDLINITMINLGDPDKVSEANVLRMLDVAFAELDFLSAEDKRKIFKNEFHIKEKEIEGGLDIMNAYLVSYGERVAKKVAAEVAEKTRAEVNNKFILNMLKKNKYPVEEIADLTGVSVDYVNHVAAQGV